MYKYIYFFCSRVLNITSCAKSSSSEIFYRSPASSSSLRKGKNSKETPSPLVLSLLLSYVARPSDVHSKFLSFLSRFSVFLLPFWISFSFSRMGKGRKEQEDEEDEEEGNGRRERGGVCYVVSFMFFDLSNSL